MNGRKIKNHKLKDKDRHEALTVMARIMYDYYGIDWEMAINLAPAAMGYLEKLLNSEH